MKTGTANLPLHGGKDGIPFPVAGETCDETIDVLSGALNSSAVDLSEKKKAFRRLKDISPRP